MDLRRLLGAILVVGGLGLVLLGGAGLLAQRSGLPASSFGTPLPGTQAPETGVPITAAPTVVPATAPPSPAPTVDTLGLIRAFFVTLEAAVRDGNQESVAANLGGAVVDRYGVAECEAFLASRDPSPEQRFEILSASGPAPWDYTTDGLTTTVPDAWTLQARVTGPNASGEVATRDAELHVQVADGMVFWFTDCGDPLS